MAYHNRVHFLPQHRFPVSVSKAPGAWNPSPQLAPEPQALHPPPQEGEPEGHTPAPTFPASEMAQVISTPRPRPTSPQEPGRTGGPWALGAGNVSAQVTAWPEAGWPADTAQLSLNVPPTPSAALGTVHLFPATQGKGFLERTQMGLLTLLGLE